MNQERLRQAPDPTAVSVMERVQGRRDGELPATSAYLDGRRGLRDEAQRWNRELDAVRGDVPRRVQELMGPGHRLARARRFLEVLGVLAAEGLVVLVLALPWILVARRPIAVLAARRLRRAFEHLGPSYVKFGQFISSGRGLFPDVLVDEFAVCRDRCPPVPLRKVRKMIERELGDAASELASFDPVPLSAASIAQVHAATLHDGTSVVVKVQRPGLERQVVSHIRSMPPIARAVQRMLPQASLANPLELVRLFARTILEELDFRLEAQNMVDVMLDLEAAGVDDVVVPRPIPGMVTRRVLVMERLEGIRFDDLQSMRNAGIDTTALLLTGIRALVEGATVFGRFHGDVHAGNVISMPDGRFGLIDFGICARLDAAGRGGLQRLLVGLATRDVRSDIAGLDALGALPDDIDRRALVTRLIAMSDDRSDLTIDDIRDEAPRVMRIFVENRFLLPMPLVLFFKNILYLNGSTRLLAPDLNLFAAFAGIHRYFDGKYGAVQLSPDGDGYGPPVSPDEIAKARAELRPAQQEGPPEPPSLLGALRRLGGPRLILDAVAPVLIFLALNRSWGLTGGIAGISAWSLGIGVYRRARGQAVGFVLPIVAGFILLRGVAGIVTQSGAVYFGPGVVVTLLAGVVLLASVVIRRPLIGLVGPVFYPFSRQARRHPVYRKVFGRLTLLWGLLAVSMALLQVWLLATGPVDRYVIVRTVVAWPLLALLGVYSFRYPRRILQKVPEFTEFSDAKAARL